jgi:hypothetical protein
VWVSIAVASSLVSLKSRTPYHSFQSTEKRHVLSTAIWPSSTMVVRAEAGKMCSRKAMVALSWLKKRVPLVTASFTLVRVRVRVRVRGRVRGRVGFGVRGSGSGVGAGSSPPTTTTTARLIW